MDKRTRVSQIYDLLRTARLNVLYYEESLLHWTWAIRSHDVLVAVTGASSPFAFMKRSSAPLDSQVWFYLTIAAGVSAILKPILRLDKQVALYSELVNHYRELFHDLKCLTDDIESERDYSPQMEKSYVKCRLREGDLQKREPPPNNRKTKRLQVRVEAEYDITARWYPD